MRIRKINTYLPVPSHIRAASTPSQFDNLNVNPKSDHPYNVSNHSDHIQPTLLTKRCNSTLDNSRLSCDENSDSFHRNLRRTYDVTDDAKSPAAHCDIKRTNSAVSTLKSNHGKRSQSLSSSEKANTTPTTTAHLHQQKHSLDANYAVSNSSGNSLQNEIRFPMTSTSTATTNSLVAATTPPAVAAPSTPTNSGTILPTQELLAELLKGSSEKLLSEQRQQIYAVSNFHFISLLIHLYLFVFNFLIFFYIHINKCICVCV